MISATSDAERCFSRRARPPARSLTQKSVVFVRACVQALRSPIAPWKNVAGEQAARRVGPISELARSSFPRHSGTIYHDSGLLLGVVFCNTFEVTRHQTRNPNRLPCKMSASKRERLRDWWPYRSFVHSFAPKDPVEQGRPFCRLSSLLLGGSWPRDG